jgi:exodeoxyribonuclease V beta subunit
LTVEGNTDAALRTSVEIAITRQFQVTPLELDKNLVASALVDVYSTPLGPLANGLTLKDFGRAETLHELNFDLPLAGGFENRRGRGAATMKTLAELLYYGLPADDPFRGWAGGLGSGNHKELRGFLTGSIDLVLKVPSANGVDSFVVSDYKSNSMFNTPGLGKKLSDYSQPHLIAEMARHDYPLQAILYQVALHRFLKLRLANYDPKVNLGGSLYLFVRGMIGLDSVTSSGSVAGVMPWQPPPSLIVELSDLLGASHD